MEKDKQNSSEMGNSILSEVTGDSFTAYAHSMVACTQLTGAAGSQGSDSLYTTSVPLQHRSSARNRAAGLKLGRCPEFPTQLYEKELTGFLMAI